MYVSLVYFRLCRLARNGSTTNVAMWATASTTTTTIERTGLLATHLRPYLTHTGRLLQSEVVHVRGDYTERRSVHSAQLCARDEERRRTAAAVVCDAQRRLSLPR